MIWLTIGIDIALNDYQLMRAWRKKTFLRPDSTGHTVWLSPYGLKISDLYAQMDKVGLGWADNFP